MTNKVLQPTTIIPAALYVERAADRQLRSIVDAMGRPGYVLVARQMGKTNLLLNMKRERVGDVIFYFDLSNRFDSVRAWFRHVIDSLLESHPDEFVSARDSISEQRRQMALEPSTEFDRSMRALLRVTVKKVIIVLDEIDSLVNASYSDTILAQIRSMYFSRVNYPEYDKLTYVLSGVAEPTDLIKDKNISPFNIGEKIYLDDFSREEFEALISRAELPLAEQVRERIFHWARGNPRMTWDICSEIEDQVLRGDEATVAIVDSLVEKLYLTGFDRTPVDHIRTLVESDSQIRDAIVAIRYGKSETLDDRAKSRLYLAGITRNAPGGAVEIKNNIIDAALSDKWISQLAGARRSLVLSATESFDAGRYDEAIRLFERASETRPPSEELTLGQQMSLGLAYLWTGRFARAAQELIRCIVLATDHPKVLQQLEYYIGVAYVASEAYQESLPHLKTAISGPDDGFVHQARIATVSVLLAIGLRQNAEEALVLCGEVLDAIQSPETPLDIELVLSALYSRTRVLSAIGRLEESRRDIHRALCLSPPEFRTAVLLLAYDLEDDNDRQHQMTVQMARGILDDRLRLPSKPTSSLRLTRERIARVLSSLARWSEDDLAFELLDYISSTLDEPGHTVIETLLDLYEELEAGEDRRSAVGLIQAIVESRSSELKSPNVRLRTFRILALRDTATQGSRWVDNYLGELEGGLVPEALGADDATTLMQIGVSRLGKGGHSDLSRVLALHTTYSSVMSERFQTQDIALTFCEMRFRKIQGDNTAARAAAARLMSRLDGPQENRAEWASAFTHMKEQAEYILSLKSISKPISDPFRRFGRNERLLVQYGDSAPVTRKFKVVENDLRSGACRLVNPSVGH